MITKIIVNVAFLFLGIGFGRIGGELRAEMRKDRVPEVIVKRYVRLYHVMALCCLVSLSFIAVSLGL